MRNATSKIIKKLLRFSNPIRLFRAMYNLIRLILLKIFHFKSFSASPYQKLAISTTIDIQGKLNIDGIIATSPGVVLTVRRNAELYIGNKVYLNRNVIVVSREKITLLEGTMVGPGVVFYDHDHKYDYDGKIGDDFITEPITIGKNCWIGANCVILRGTVLGDHSIVGAGTVLKGVYPPYSKIYSNREIIIKEIVSNIKEKNNKIGEE